MMNPELKIGDEIMLYHMDDEIHIPPGTKGSVTKIVNDPFEEGNKIIHVRWENGSTLSILSNYDVYKLVKKKIDESDDPYKFDPYAKWMAENRDIKKFFDLSYYKKFYEAVRESGVENMFGAGPLLYYGKDNLERYYGQGREDDDTFNELLNIADDAKAKFISQLVDYGIHKKIDLNDESALNRMAGKIASKLLTYYMQFH